MFVDVAPRCRVTLKRVSSQALLEPSFSVSSPAGRRDPGRPVPLEGLHILSVTGSPLPPGEDNVGPGQSSRRWATGRKTGHGKLSVSTPAGAKSSPSLLEWACWHGATFCPQVPRALPTPRGGAPLQPSESSSFTSLRTPRSSTDHPSLGFCFRLSAQQRFRCNLCLLEGERKRTQNQNRTVSPKILSY